MAPLGLIGTADSESSYDLPEATMASSASTDTSQIEAGMPSHKRNRPCRRKRANYHKVVVATASQIESNPFIFDMDDMELNLPLSVTQNPWLKRKFIRRMGIFKQKYLEERQHPMYVSSSVELQDESSNTLAENLTREERPLDSVIQPMKVDVGNVRSLDREDQRLITEMDTGRMPLRVLHGEGCHAPAVVIMIPKMEEISLPMKLLSRTPTVTGLEA